MYGGDSSGSSSEDSEDDEKKPDTRDSDTELKVVIAELLFNIFYKLINCVIKEIIKRKKAEFSKIEREIEEKLAEAEKTADDQQSRGGTPETNDNDSQVDAKHQGQYYINTKKKEVGRSLLGFKHHLFLNNHLKLFFNCAY